MSVDNCCDESGMKVAVEHVSAEDDELVCLVIVVQSDDIGDEFARVKFDEVSNEAAVNCVGVDNNCETIKGSEKFSQLKDT